MVSLSNATRETRLILKYGAIFIGVVILLTVFLRFGEFVKLTYFTKPIPPEQGFGTLPPLALGKSEKIEYRINTLTGLLPVFGDRVRVYKMAQPQINLLTLENTKRKLRKYQFSENEKKINDLIYEWTNLDDSSRIITYNILWDDFSITSDYKNNSQLTQSLITLDAAKKSVSDFLGSLIDDFDTLEFDDLKTKQYKLEEGRLVEENNISSQFIQLSLKYKKINDFDIYFPNLNDTEMDFLITEVMDNPIIAEARFIHRKIDFTSSSTYHLKTSRQAYNELLDGNAKRIITGEVKDNDILDVYISYYIEEEKPQYLTPVIVFKGKNFYALVDALSNVSPISTSL